MITIPFILIVVVGILLLLAVIRLIGGCVLRLILTVLIIGLVLFLISRFGWRC
jgi:hypothetical protein